MQRDEQAVAEKAASLVESRKKAKAARKDIFKRAESYVEEYRSQVCSNPASGMFTMSSISVLVATMFRLLIS